MPDLGRMFPYDARDVCDACTVCDNLPIVIKVNATEWQAGCPHCGICADTSQDYVEALLKWNILHRGSVQDKGKLRAKLCCKGKFREGPWKKLKKTIRGSGTCK